MCNKHNNRFKGFTLVELLISLVIMGLLMAALGVAMNASAVNYRQNQDIFDATNKARQALTRITSQIRTGYVDPNDVANTTSCTVLCADGSTVTYNYDSDDNTLYLQSGAASYVLCDNVTAMTFTKDDNTESGDVISVQISMTVTQGQTIKTVSSAAVLRKVLE